MISRIVFAAGGTGGHIYPAIAVADEVKKANEKANIKFIGVKGRIEEKIIPQNGYELKTLDVQGFRRSLSPKNIKVVLKFMKASKEAAKFLKDYKPEIVFGTGGFVSGPVLWSAVRLGIPSVIQEGNSYPGITVKWLSPRVDKVIINFEETKKYLKRRDNIELIPYPVRVKLRKHSKTEALQYFGLNMDKKTLFVFGGSQGAKSINIALTKVIGNLVKNNIQIIWQTGEEFYDMAVKNAKQPDGIKILKYIDNIDYAYSASDLIVCRSGISTVMELASFGAAAIFVPYPHATENHQEKNARSLVEKKAAVMILDNMLSEKLEQIIYSLINNAEELNELQTNIKQFADIGAASKISNLLEEMVNKSKN